MSIKLISFDLQGTLSDHSFSSEIWLSLFPKALETARERIGAIRYDELMHSFQNTGEEDLRYYDIDYWLRSVCSSESTHSLALQAETAPLIFPEMKELVRSLKDSYQVIVLSATTREFIELEMGAWRDEFRDTLSTFDDLKVPGKPSEIFLQIAERFGRDPEECLHIGDHEVMDGINPKQAGWHSIYDHSDVPPNERAERVRQYLRDKIAHERM